MALQPGASRDALFEAVASKAAASEAAEEGFGHDNQRYRVGFDLSSLKWTLGACGADIISRFSGMEVLLPRTRSLGT